MARGYQKCRDYMLMLKEETGNENAVGAARENWSRGGGKKKRKKAKLVYFDPATYSSARALTPSGSG